MFLESEALANFHKILGIILTIGFGAVFVGILLLIGKIVLTLRRKRDIIANGTPFDAQIIGAAHENILKTTPTASIKLLRDMELGGIIPRLKISYKHPVTRVTVIEHRILINFEDQRLITILYPRARNKYSQSSSLRRKVYALYDTYLENLNTRYISEDEKERLTNVAKQKLDEEMEKIDAKFRISYEPDTDGYYILNPPVQAEGYMLNEETVFVQRTLEDLSYDWTQELE